MDHPLRPAVSLVVPWAVLWAAVLSACGGMKGQSAHERAAESTRGTSRASVATANPIEDRPVEDPNAAFRQAVRELRVHLDLLALAHLADVDQGGLYLDIGTPARPKYTHGNWRNEWGAPDNDADRTFAPFGHSATFWFQEDAPSSKVLWLALRRRGTPALVAYLNGETLGTLELRDGWNDYTLPIPQQLLRTGENKLQLRATETTMVAGKPVSVDLDAIHFRTQPESLGENQETPQPAPANYQRSQGSVRVAEGAEGVRRAWSLDTGTRVRFTVEVPHAAQLSFGWGTTGNDTTAIVRVRDGNREPTVLWSGPVPNHHQDFLVSLERFAGKIVALEFETSGPSRSEIGLSHPEVLIPLPDKPRIPGQAKNAVVLTIDTLRATKLRPYNRRSRVRTPAFDAFTEDATLFERAQSPENWTKPSVASILTALSPTTHGTKEDGSSLPDEALTLGEIYKGAGFATAAFLANGYVSDRFGFKQGWDHYTNYIRENRNTEAETVFREAIAWIRAHQDERFFVYLQTIDPHVPYDPPNAFLRLYDPEPNAYRGQISNRRTAYQLGDAKKGRLTFSDEDKQRLRDLHDGEISYHDRYFGKFLEELQELGLYEDMVFVVTSDHGEEFDEHGSWGHGHSVYQELLHVPLVVRWPQADATGMRVPETVGTVDIAPTVLEATGVDVPEVFEGSSLLGFMRGQPPTGPAVAFSEFLEDRRVITGGGYKLIVRGNHRSTLFHLASDPGEEEEIHGGQAHALGLRYTRILLGQYLGASDRRRWLAAPTSAGDTAAPRVLPSTDVAMDRELCEHLKMLGYHQDACED